jgi:hypothetical protein
LILRIRSFAAEFSSPPIPNEYAVWGFSFSGKNKNFWELPATYPHEVGRRQASFWQMAKAKGKGITAEKFPREGKQIYGRS